MKQQKRNRKLNNIVPMGDGGFSLIEVIIAIAILALISMPLLNYFLDSLRHSALMAKRQNATLAAQELTEAMKSADYLVRENVDPLTNTVTYTLENLPAGLDNISISPFHQTGAEAGRGEFTVTAEKDDRFDVSILVSTDNASNDTERALVQGLSDTDVILLERSQQAEAVMYFTAINTEYCALNPVVAPLTQAEIEANMTRIIYVNVIKNSSDYTVQAYYDYSCEGLRGAGSAAVSFQSSYLANVRIENPSSLYLLYDCLESSPGDLRTDTVEMNIPDSSVDPNLKLGIYLVAQNFPATRGAYTIQINGCNSSDPRLSFHCNYETADHLKVGTAEITNKQPLTGTGKPLRIIKITTQVFELGHAPGDEPLATMESTKGE